MATTPVQDLTIASLAELIRQGEISPVEITEKYLERIDAMDRRLNAFREVCPNRALDQAKAMENLLRAGHDFGPLHGIPLAVKDLIDVGGLPTTAGTHLFESRVARESATVVKRLSQNGMVTIGKTNTVQFAYSGIGINHDHGTPHNPWKEAHHIPGGSSSGSGVAVAAGMVPAALGTDTGGSIRVPAALCAITGLKTTVGRVSRHGVYPLSSTMDSVGPMAGTAEDTALIYQAIHGVDTKDPGTWNRPFQDVLHCLRKGAKGMRVAFAEYAFWEDVHPEIEKAVRSAGDVFRDAGASVISINFEEAKRAAELNANGLIIAAEAYTQNKEWLENHFDKLDPVVAHRMIKGKTFRAPEYIENMQTMAQLRESARETLCDIDALLVPTTIIPAEPVAGIEADMALYTEKNIAYLRNTSIGNILDLCALSIPCGFTREGLPIGLMIYAKGFHEETVLRLGYAFQQRTKYHKRQPDLSWI